IRVGITTSLSGEYAELGLNELHGVQMWAHDINLRAGLLGRKVIIVHYDDGSSPEKSARLYERLIVQDHVDLLLGPYGSDITFAASQVAGRYDIPMVATGAASSRIWDQGLPNIYQIDTPAADYMVPPLALARDKGLKRIALIYADNEFPREVAEGVRAAVTKYGMQLVYDQVYPQDNTDFRKIIQQMRTTRPEAVVGGSYFDDSVALVKAICQAGMEPKMIALTVGPALDEFGEQLGSDANGIMGAVAWMRGARIPLAYDFAFRYKEKYGINPSVAVAYGYGGGQVLEAAVRLAGSLDKDAITAQLKTMTFRSILGNYQVDASGKQVAKKAYTMQWQDGHRRLVIPERIAESQVIFPLKPCSQR
ncbi:MAG: amino acid ABC transporter substrate-binding protein, partial [Gammaproteobacteria bacterium]|nr:amino acid ABC transporter substrate-binding protein [Gammaproteobacteria bacterium]